MKKLIPALLALLNFQAKAATYDCHIGDSDNTFQIIENVPSQGYATIQSADNASVVTFTTSIESQGCFATHHKIFFHPYYDFKLSKELGLEGTRCFTLDDGIWKGFYNAEMQKPKPVTCVIHVSEETTL